MHPGWSWIVYFSKNPLLKVLYHGQLGDSGLCQGTRFLYQGTITSVYTILPGSLSILTVNLNNIENIFFLNFVMPGFDLQSQ